MPTPLRLDSRRVVAQALQFGCHGMYTHLTGASSAFWCVVMSRLTRCGADSTGGAVSKENPKCAKRPSKSHIFENLLFSRNFPSVQYMTFRALTAIT